MAQLCWASGTWAPAVFSDLVDCDRALYSSSKFSFFFFVCALLLFSLD
jgi:hypothetical protein